MAKMVMRFFHNQYSDITVFKYILYKYYVLFIMYFINIMYIFYKYNLFLSLNNFIINLPFINLTGLVQFKWNKVFKFSLIDTVLGVMRDRQHKIIRLISWYIKINNDQLQEKSEWSTRVYTCNINS